MEDGTPEATASCNVWKHEFAFCPQDKLLLKNLNDVKFCAARCCTEIEMLITDCVFIVYAEEKQ